MEQIEATLRGADGYLRAVQSAVLTTGQTMNCVNTLVGTFKEESFHGRELAKLCEKTLAIQRQLNTAMSKGAPEEMRAGLQARVGAFKAEAEAVRQLRQQVAALEQAIAQGESELSTLRSLPDTNPIQVQQAEHNLRVKVDQLKQTQSQLSAQSADADKNRLGHCARTLVWLVVHQVTMYNSMASALSEFYGSSMKGALKDLGVSDKEVAAFTDLINMKRGKVGGVTAEAYIKQNFAIDAPRPASLSQSRTSPRVAPAAAAPSPAPVAAASSPRTSSVPGTVPSSAPARSISTSSTGGGLDSLLSGWDMSGANKPATPTGGAPGNNTGRHHVRHPSLATTAKPSLHPGYSSTPSTPVVPRKAASMPGGAGGAMAQQPQQQQQQQQQQQLNLGALGVPDKLKDIMGDLGGGGGGASAGLLDPSLNHMAQRATAPKGEHDDMFDMWEKEMHAPGQAGAADAAATIDDDFGFQAPAQAAHAAAAPAASAGGDLLSFGGVGGGSGNQAAAPGDDLMSFGANGGAGGSSSSANGGEDASQMSREELAQRRIQGVSQRANEALEEHQRRVEEEARAKESMAEIDAVLKARVFEWAKGKNIRAQLSSLQDVLWATADWAPVSMADCVTASSVKKHYRKAIMVVHPDKNQNACHEQQVLAKLVFDRLQDNFRVFREKENA